jgi:DNA-binding response OmpR family regulator
MAHRILIADDSEQLRQSLVMILIEAGYLVFAAATGNEALAQVKSFDQQFDLLITDIGLPDMDGLQLLTEIRGIHPVLPVIAISGSFSARFYLEFASTFGVPTLEKPFKASTLLKIVESVLLKKASPTVR